MQRWDTRNFSDAQRETLAWKIHEADDWKLPSLALWNYDLCRKHRNGWVEDFFDPQTQEDKQRTVYDRPMPGCRKCAIHPKVHQRIGIAWLYFKKRALLADTMGAGKTTCAGGVIAMMAETGELGDQGSGRVIITPRAPALHQWYAELKRMMPSLDIAIAEGSKKQRIQTYLSPWQVLLIGPEMLRNDHEALERFKIGALITDDIDQLRNPETETSYVLDRMGNLADRYIIMSGTPLQKRLPELHSVLDAIGGLQAFGSMDTFIKSHVRTENIKEYDRRTGRETVRKQIVGYKNTDVIKRKIAPMVLRRTAADLKDVTLPTIIPDDVMLDLYPAQRTKYTELQRGVIKLLSEGGDEVNKKVTALSKIHYGAAICAGLAALGEPDGPRTSVKLDWVLNTVTEGGLSDEKVVVFARLKNTIRALQDRLRTAGVGFETVWGDQPDKRERQKSQDRFWDDPRCRILLGTGAIEQSLNLQVSRHLVNVDMILNPARMAQLAGRIRRQGSAYQHVFVHNLLTVKTQEERYLAALEREQALADHIWDEDSDLFGGISPLELLQMISG